MTAEYIGKCEIIDWQDVIHNINNIGATSCRCPSAVHEWIDKADNNYQEPYKTEIHNLVNKWCDSNFNFDFIIVDEWFFPVDHDLSVKFGNFVNCDPEVVYVSKINPGHGIPEHWDIDDCELKHLEKGPNKRFTCFMSEPDIGHMFIMGEQHLYNQPSGAVWAWDNYKTEHIGINFGLTPKYLFNFLGISRNS